MESSLAQSTERLVYVVINFWRIGLGDKDKSSKEVIEERAKQMAKVVCICKGINLGRVLAGIQGCETVQDVNRKVGTGSGGCQGQRCGPRIKVLIEKIAQSK
jgi:hypothetical protein